MPQRINPLTGRTEQLPYNVGSLPRQPQRQPLVQQAQLQPPAPLGGTPGQPGVQRRQQPQPPLAPGAGALPQIPQQIPIPQLPAAPTAGAGMDPQLRDLMRRLVLGG